MPKAHAMPLDFAVRHATPGDLEALVRLAHDVEHAAHWDGGSFRGYLLGKDPGILQRTALLAVANGQAVGFAAGSYLEGDEAAELLNLGVEERFRRHGVARALVTALQAWAQDQGARALDLEVRVSNAVAQSVYQRLGFVQAGRRAGYYQHPAEDALLLRAIFPRV